MDNHGNKRTSFGPAFLNGSFIKIFYSITAILLFFYTFTQVDLGLTLTRWPFWLPFQQFFQHIGYFDRPLSTTLYVAIISLFFILYALLLYQGLQNRISRKEIWILILFVSVLLAFSYNAFSYDIFNYIFDAKIWTYYGQNPYEHKALDFPTDPMLGFMHWTHRTYPYGPIWLLFSVPLSYLGFHLLLPTLILFKLAALGSFVGTVYFIQKILQKIDKERALVGTLFFAFNPLVLIESLVSGHNDIMMMFLAMGAFYFLLEKKYIPSYVFLFLSIGIKFATVFLLPVFLIVTVLYIQKKNIPWEKVIFFASFSMVIAVIFACFRSEFQPWYLLWVFPLLAMLTRYTWITIPTLFFSLSILFYYAIFFYFGNWDPRVPTIKMYIAAFSMTLAVVLFSLSFYKQRALFKKK